MYSRVSTSRAKHDGHLARDTHDSRFQRSLDGWPLRFRLPLEAMIVGAVVLNATRKFHLVTRAICAISAASPIHHVTRAGASPAPTPLRSSGPNRTGYGRGLPPPWYTLHQGDLRHVGG